MREADCPVGLCGSSIGMCKHIHSLLPLPESNKVQSLFFCSARLFVWWCKGEAKANVIPFCVHFILNFSLL